MVDESPFEPVADIIAASGHIGYRWDLLSDHIEWLGPWQQLFGKERDIPPVNARELSACILANDHYLVFNEMPVAFDREYRFRTDKGVLIWVQEHGTTDYENGHAVRQQGLLRLIEKKLEPPRHYASPDRDALTGRPNRACLLSALDKLLSGPRLNRQYSAYLVVGIDNLAFINDAMGTKAADQLICSVADRLNDLCPTRAMIGRVGGDMFGILLPQMAKDMVSTLKEPDGAEKMKAKWQSGAFGMPGAEPSAEEMDSTDPDSAPGKAGGQEGAAPQGQGMPPEVQDALKGMFGK